MPVHDALEALPVQDEDRTGYERMKFRHWIDADRDGCDTRNEVLLEEAVTAPKQGPGCQLTDGSWCSPYDDTYFTQARALDHLVPLAEARDSGASTRTAKERGAYANDLDDARALIAVSATSNRSKADHDPATWQPPAAGYRCIHATGWIAVKTRWGLTADPAEGAHRRPDRLPEHSRPRHPGPLRTRQPKIFATGCGQRISLRAVTPYWSDMPLHTLAPGTRRRLGLLVAAAVALGLAPAAAAGPVTPVLDRNFPDPDIVKAAGTYHAYATNGDGKHIQHANSRDLVRWKVDSGDVLPVLGSWAEPEAGKVWAPEVYDNGDGFTMQYTARDRASDKQCIGVALSSSADGPFRPVGDGPLVCPATQGGAIDASSYTEDGQRYLLWKSDGNCCGLDTWLHLQPTSWDGTRTTGEPVRLIRQDPDPEREGRLVEAPTLVKRDGRYVLFYSADDYRGEMYKTSYAVADLLTGPYTKAANPLMTTGTFSGAVRGPGGQDVVTGPDGRDRIVFHGWNSGRRVMYLADLGFAGGYPVVRGSKVLYQAENARVHRAVVRDAASASDGRAVGGIDHADSHVEFTVFAASAGRHLLSVRFSNGSQDSAGSPVGATHRLTVNSTSAGSVRYPHTGWDNWQTAETAITLREGWNTIRLSKGAYFAELDSVKVA